MVKRLIALIIIFMGLYFIYDHNLYGSQQFVRDIKQEVYLPTNDSYVKKDIKVSFVQMTNDFIPNNKQDLLNIYYTVINSGWSNFTFYCNYSKCLDDVNKMSTDTILLSNLNSFVSPYNQYSTIHTYTTPLLNNKVNIIITREYNNTQIEAINSKIDQIYNALNLTNPNLNIRDKIRLVHDYIINHTKYDALKIDNINDNTYDSSTAYGLLFQGYAVCSGYSDTMSLFLDKMGIPNMRVTSSSHVWNLVYLDNKWYHLDLTWDDPYSTNGTDSVNHNFFLINYNTLKQWNTAEHVFDETVYKEAL